MRTDRGDGLDRRPPRRYGTASARGWEGGLIIGKGGKSVAATLVERRSRFVTILGLPEGKNADGLSDVLIDHVADMPALLRGSLPWDQGTELARHVEFTLATKMPVYFAHPHSPWERSSNEDTNGHLLKGIGITSHQPYLNAIAEALNDRPRQTLGFRTPSEVLKQLLLEDPVATTT